MTPESRQAQVDEFEAAWRTSYGAVLAFVSRRLPEAESARDVTDEAFVVAWRRYLRDGTAPSRPWLFGIARRVLANHQRSETRRSRLLARVASETPSPATAPEADEPSRAGGAFNRLNEADREVLALIAWDELSVREAAAVLGISAPNFSVRLYRARRRLRQKLEASGHLMSTTTDPRATRSATKHQVGET